MTHTDLAIIGLFLMIIVLLVLHGLLLPRIEKLEKWQADEDDPYAHERPNVRRKVESKS